MTICMTAHQKIQFSLSITPAISYKMSENEAEPDKKEGHKKNNFYRILSAMLIVACILTATLSAMADEPETVTIELSPCEVVKAEEPQPEEPEGPEQVEEPEKVEEPEQVEDDEDDFVPPLPTGNSFRFDEEGCVPELPGQGFDPFKFPDETQDGIPIYHRFEHKPELAPEEDPEEVTSDKEEEPKEEGPVNRRKETVYSYGDEGESDFSNWDFTFSSGGMEGGYGSDFGGYVRRMPNGEVDHGYGVFLGADGRAYIMEVEIGGELGTENYNVKSRIVGTVGEFGFNGSASLDFSDGFPVLYVGTEVGATAGAIGGQLGGTIGGVEISAEGKVVVGCGIKGYMHFEGGKLVIDMGASCGVGFEASFSVDVGAIVNKIKAGFEKEYNARMDKILQKQMRKPGNWDDSPDEIKLRGF